MNLVAGKVYECRAEDMAEIPVEIQIQMFEGGRLRAARYEGDGRWHVFDDAEMLVHQDLSLRSLPALATEDELPALKLDLGCGLNPKEGFEGVDLYSDKAAHRVNLFRFPWPWANESVGELHSSHFLEHVPAREVEERDVDSIDPAVRTKFVGQDFLFAVIDECWRILAPGGRFRIVVPNARSDGAFQDPTHRRFWNQFTFGYFHKNARKELGVSHYRVAADFQVTQLTPVGPVEIGLMHPEVQQKKWRTEWNAIYEWHALLRKPLEDKA